jgi:hypothetical protein
METRIMKMNKIRFRIESQIKNKVKNLEKSNTALLEQKLNDVQEDIDGLMSEVKDEYSAHFKEHRNNIFVPVLDEATGEKTYEPKSLDEFLSEYQNPKSIEEYDSLYEILDESVEYEASFYFGNKDEALSEIEALDKLKQLGSKAVEKVKGAYKKGLLFFFLKLVEQGLKAALTVSRGAFGLIRTLLVSRVVTPLIKAWAEGKAKASGVWAKIRAWSASTLPKIMKRIMGPFLWIATKITGNAKRAGDVAPLLFNITILSLMLAWVYLSGGMDVFFSTTSAIENGMQAGLEAVPEQAAAGLCMEANINTDGMTLEQLIIEACGVIDMNGNEVREEVIAKVMKDMATEINSRANELTATYMTTFQETVTSGAAGVEATEYAEHLSMGKSEMDRSLRALENLSQRLAGVWEGAPPEGVAVGGEGQVAHLADEKFWGDLNDVIQKRIDMVQASGNQLAPVSNEELEALSQSVSLNSHVSGVIQTSDQLHTQNGELVKAVEEMFSQSRVRHLGINIGGEMGPSAASPEDVAFDPEKAAAVAKPAARSIAKPLQEKQIARFKELAGIVKG